MHKLGMREHKRNLSSVRSPNLRVDAPTRCADNDDRVRQSTERQEVPPLARQLTSRHSCARRDPASFGSRGRLSPVMPGFPSVTAIHDEVVAAARHLLARQGIDAGEPSGDRKMLQAYADRCLGARASVVLAAQALPGSSSGRRTASVLIEEMT